jgi:hypothetical protein
MLKKITRCNNNIIIRCTLYKINFYFTRGEERSCGSCDGRDDADRTLHCTYHSRL